MKHPFPELMSQAEIDREEAERRKRHRRAVLHEKLSEFFLILLPWSVATFLAVKLLGGA